MLVKTLWPLARTFPLNIVRVLLHGLLCIAAIPSNRLHLIIWHSLGSLGSLRGSLGSVIWYRLAAAIALHLRIIHKNTIRHHMRPILRRIHPREACLLVLLLHGSHLRRHLTHRLLLWKCIRTHDLAYVGVCKSRRSEELACS